MMAEIVFAGRNERRPGDVETIWLTDRSRSGETAVLVRQMGVARQWHISTSRVCVRSPFVDSTPTSETSVQQMAMRSRRKSPSSRSKSRVAASCGPC